MDSYDGGQFIEYPKQWINHFKMNLVVKFSV